VVLYWCETWSDIKGATQTECFKEQALRRICGPKRTGEEQHNLELNNLYILPSIIRRFLGGKARPARKADNLTAICEPIV
jgi:hypothetical protein